MCAILDSNVTNQVGTSSRLGAAQGFYDWLMEGRGSLVYSDKFLKEEVFVPSISKDAKRMIVEFEQSGIAIKADPIKMEKERRYLQTMTANINSNEDLEILALARATGARLLFSNDKKLHEDFKNALIVNNPRGKIYTTNDSRTGYTSAHRKLLDHPEICKPR